MVIDPMDDMLSSVRTAAEALMFKALELSDDTPILAIAALMLAAGSAAGMAKVPYEDMIALISRYYEGVLVAEAEGELAASVPYLPGESN